MMDRQHPGGRGGVSEADLKRYIRLRAYLLWEVEGRQDGRADEYWHRARERVQSETRSAYPQTKSQRHRT